MFSSVKPAARNPNLFENRILHTTTCFISYSLSFLSFLKHFIEENVGTNINVFHNVLAALRSQ